MSSIKSQAIELLRNRITDAINKAIASGALIQADIPDFIIETPSDRSHGDLATNAAMACARAFRTAPVKIAQAIKDNIELDGSYFNKIEIAGPGFINFFFSPVYFADVVNEVNVLKEKYGRSSYGEGKRIIVEFVSANPTGPMHMGNARGGALGDCLAAVLDTAGYDVWREFYVNDAGNQIEKFAVSLEARYLQIFKGEENVPFPEDGYQGMDIKDHAAAYAAEYGDSLLNADSQERKKALVDYALPKNIAKMQADMAKYRISYDKWFFESELHSSGFVKDTIDILKDKGMTYEKDGALWYRATALGAEKDEVLIRANGNPTYFASDIAYHRNKLETRGFDRSIDIWGADHHGHVARMKGAMNAIGLDGDKLDVVLMQLVKLVRNGQIVTMSKRTGKAIQLSDLLDEVSVDSARFLFNMREANTQMDFDLDLAVTQDSQNPVYYVQYAHARICSILKNLQNSGITPRTCTKQELMLLKEPEEIELIHHLASYTEEIIAAAKSYDPTQITRYVINLATLFHKFYNACRVHTDDDKLTQARINLCLAVKTVIVNVLTMFNITAPEAM